MAAVNGTVLVVDDDRPRGMVLKRGLSRTFDCHVANTADEAMGLLAAHQWTAVVADFDLGGPGTGLQVLQCAWSLARPRAAILYTVHFVDGLAQLARSHARADAVLDARTSGFVAQLRTELLDLVRARRRSFPPAGCEAWCAASPRTTYFLDRLRQAAEERGKVYVIGEPGSGKRLAALTLHAWRSGSQVDSKGRPDKASSVDPPTFLRVPPLRERLEDLPKLATRRLEVRSSQLKSACPILDEQATAMLAERPWWGNVRELFEVLDRALSAGMGRSVLSGDDLPRDILPPPSQYRLDAAEAERQAMILRIWACGSVNESARRGGETSSNLRRRLKALGILRIDRPDAIPQLPPDQTAG